MIDLDFIVRLPQTLIRAYAFPELSSSNVIIYPFRIPGKPFYREGVEEGVLDLMSILAKPLSKKVTYLSGGILNMGLKEPVLDYNLLHNLNTGAISKERSISIVEYAETILCPKFGDLLLSPSHVAKKLGQSLKLKQKFNIRTVYDASSIMSFGIDSPYLPWFWRAVSGSKSKFQELLSEASPLLAMRSSFYRQYINSKMPILLVFVSHVPRERAPDELIDQLIVGDRELRMFVESSKPEVYIKPHRAFPKTDSLSRYFEKKLGLEVFSPRDEFDLWIPSELFLNTKEYNFAVCETGSTVFSVQSAKLKHLLRESDAWHMNSYGLSFARAAKVSTNA